MLFDFCARYGLSIRDTTFEHRVVDKKTWYKVRLSQGSVIDFVIKSSTHQPMVDILW